MAPDAQLGQPKRLRVTECGRRLQGSMQTDSSDRSIRGIREHPRGAMHGHGSQPNRVSRDSDSRDMLSAAAELVFVLQRNATATRPRSRETAKARNRGEVIPDWDLYGGRRGAAGRDAWPVQPTQPPNQPTNTQHPRFLVLGS
jgi:hypothetical protein